MLLRAAAAAAPGAAAAGAARGGWRAARRQQAPSGGIRRGSGAARAAAAAPSALPRRWRAAAARRCSAAASPAASETGAVECGAVTDPELLPAAPAGVHVAAAAASAPPGRIAEALASAANHVLQQLPEPSFCVVTVGCESTPLTADLLQEALPEAARRNLIGATVTAPAGGAAEAVSGRGFRSDGTGEAQRAHCCVTAVCLPPGAAHRCWVQTAGSLPKLPEVDLNRLREAAAGCGVLGLMTPCFVGQPADGMPRRPRPVQAAPTAAQGFVERTSNMFPACSIFAACGHQPGGAAVPRAVFAADSGGALRVEGGGLAGVFLYVHGAGSSDIVWAVASRAFARYPLGPYIVTQQLQSALLDAPPPPAALPTLEDQVMLAGATVVPPEGSLAAPLPVFALPSVYVFPGRTKLLRIFEPRYLRLLRRHTEDRSDPKAPAAHFVLASTEPDQEGTLHGTLCSVSAATYADNRQAFVQLRGIARVAVDGTAAAACTDFGLPWHRVKLITDGAEDPLEVAELLSAVAALRRKVQQEVAAEVAGRGAAAPAAAAVGGQDAPAAPQQAVSPPPSGAGAAAAWAAAGDGAALEATSFALAAEVLRSLTLVQGQWPEVVRRLFTTQSTSQRLRDVARLLSTALRNEQQSRGEGHSAADTPAAAAGGGTAAPPSS